MRHVLTSFLSVHWAIVFALLALTMKVSTKGTISFSPAIINSATDPRQNCSGSADDNDDITLRFGIHFRT